jgi:hypothetical protein
MSGFVTCPSSRVLFVVAATTKAILSKVSREGRRYEHCERTHKIYGTEFTCLTKVVNVMSAASSTSRRDGRIGDFSVSGKRDPQVRFCPEDTSRCISHNTLGVYISHDDSPRIDAISFGRCPYST